VVLYIKINCELLIISVFFISGDKVPSEILRLDSERESASEISYKSTDYFVCACVF